MLIWTDKKQIIVITNSIFITKLSFTEIRQLIWLIC